MDKTNVKVEFSIFGDEINPEVITSTLKIKPTRQWLKGDHIRNDLFRKESCWEISTEYEESYDINDQLDKIIDRISDKESEIHSLLKTYNAECKFEIVIQIENNEKPAMYITRERITFLNDIRASIDFDLYIYS